MKIRMKALVVGCVLLAGLGSSYACMESQATLPPSEPFEVSQIIGGFSEHFGPNAPLNNAGKAAIKKVVMATNQSLEPQMVALKNLAAQEASLQPTDANLPKLKSLMDREAKLMGEIAFAQKKALWSLMPSFTLDQQKICMRFGVETQASTSSSKSF